MMLKCNGCRNLIDIKLGSCPYCGTKTEDNNQARVLKIIFWFISIIFLIVIIAIVIERGDGPASPQSESINSISVVKKDEWRPDCEVGTKVDNYFVTKNDTQLYAKPSLKSEKIKNERTNDNRIVGPDYQLRAECETKNWIKGHIVRVDGDEVGYETGWVKKSSVISTTVNKPEVNQPANNTEECIAKGNAYLIKMGSWPIMSTGRNSAEFVKERCINNINAYP